jgi:hypothetical protein
MTRINKTNLLAYDQRTTCWLTFHPELWEEAKAILPSLEVIKKEIKDAETKAKIKAEKEFWDDPSAFRPSWLDDDDCFDYANLNQILVGIECEYDNAYLDICRILCVDSKPE